MPILSNCAGRNLFDRLNLPAAWVAHSSEVDLPMQINCCSLKANVFATSKKTMGSKIAFNQA
jgi:hypothetical protein